MIDNYSKVMDLMEKMKEHLPIPVTLTKLLIQSLNENGAKITKDMEFEIVYLAYLGDDGGICCTIA